jgi:hypothetical protein
MRRAVHCFFEPVILLLSRLYLAPFHSPRIHVFTVSLLLVFLALAPPKAMVRFLMFLPLRSLLQDPTLGGPRPTVGFPYGMSSPFSHGPFTSLSTLIVSLPLLNFSLVDCIGVWFFSSMLFALGATAAFVVFPMAPPAYVRLVTNGFDFLTSLLVPAALGKFGMPLLKYTSRAVTFSVVTCILSLDRMDI